MPNIAYADHSASKVSVVHCPRICGNRLVHLSQAGQASWVIRDFVTGQMLRRSPQPNASYSNRSLADIEAQIEHSEIPPFYNIENTEDWTVYLRLRSNAVLRGNAPDNSRPNPDFGEWREM